VAFIETGASGDSGLLLDEHMLALRISDFLTKCPQWMVRNYDELAAQDFAEEVELVLDIGKDSTLV